MTFIRVYPEAIEGLVLAVDDGSGHNEECSGVWIDEVALTAQDRWSVPCYG